MNEKINNIKYPNRTGKNIEKHNFNTDKTKNFYKNNKKEYSIEKFKNKVNNPKVIANSISYYNLGNSQDETVNHIFDKHKVKVQNSTLQKWIEDFNKICNNKKIRTNIVKNHRSNVINSFTVVIRYFPLFTRYFNLRVYYKYKFTTFQFFMCLKRLLFSFVEPERAYWAVNKYFLEGN